MKHFFAFILILAPIVVLGFTDLGKWGQIYEIKEHVEFKDTNLSLLSQKNVNKSINYALTSKVKLPTCTKSNKRIINFTRVLDKDIDMPKFNLHIPKGTTFNPLEYGNFGKYLLMIDGSDENQTKLANYYKNNSVIIIYNASIYSLGKRYHTPVFIADKSFQKSFKVNCLPSFYIQKDKKILVYEIAIKDLIMNGED
jgi:hypothetical protein